MATTVGWAWAAAFRAQLTPHPKFQISERRHWNLEVHFCFQINSGRIRVWGDLPSGHCASESGCQITWWCSTHFFLHEIDTHHFSTRRLGCFSRSSYFSRSRGLPYNLSIQGFFEFCSKCRLANVPHYFIAYYGWDFAEYQHPNAINTCASYSHDKGRTAHTETKAKQHAEHVKIVKLLSYTHRMNMVNLNICSWTPDEQANGSGWDRAKARND